jgi:hypothetical protein
MRSGSAGRVLSAGGYNANWLGTPPTGGGGIAITAPTAYWTLAQTSGSLLDACASPFNLTPTSLTQGASGRITNAIQSTGTTSHASGTTTTKMNPGSGTWSLAGWFYPVGDNVFFMQYGDGSNGDGFYLYYNSISTGTELNIYEGGKTRSIPRTLLALSLNTWHYVVAWWDGTNANIQVDNGTIFSAASTAVVASTQWTFLSAGSFLGSLSGTRLCEWGWWKGYVLTTADKTYLYNSGSGHTFNGTIWT